MAAVSAPERDRLRQGQSWPFAAVAVAAVLTLVIDLSLPTGLADRLAYLGLVLLGWWLARPRDVLLLAGLATLLIAVGHLVAANGDGEGGTLAGTGLVLLAVWATAGVLATAKRRCHGQDQRIDALRAQVREQTARASAMRTHSELTSRIASDLLSGMSHELRTPLNAIIGFAEIVRTEMFGPIGSDRYRGYLQDIHESGRHLLELINNLLDIARIDAGRVEMEDEAIDVAEIVRTSLSEVAERARSGQIALAVDVVAGMPPIGGDRRMLQQVLRNLLANAVKFTPAGGHIRVAAWCRPETGCVLQVADTGKGIALKDIPHVLAPFGHVPDETRPRQGSGLGLPLSKALVELHAGTLDLQSEPGAGTTVTVRLPASRVRALPAVA